MRIRATCLGLALGLALVACAPSGRTPELGAEAEPATPAVRLPPAWTATSAPTPIPPSLTPSPTSEPTLAPRLLQDDLGTPLPTAVWIAARVPGSLDGWSQHDVGSATLWLPGSWSLIDMGGLGEAMGLLMASLAQGMVEAFGEMAGPGEGGTPSAQSLEEMQAAFAIDFVMAADEQARAALFLVGEPPPADADLQDLLLKAINDNAGEVVVERTALVAEAAYPMAQAWLHVKDAETGQVSRQALYVLLGQNRLWTLSYQTEPDLFEELLPVFEQSAATLQGKP